MMEGGKRFEGVLNGRGDVRLLKSREGRVNQEKTKRKREIKSLGESIKSKGSGEVNKSTGQKRSNS